MLGDANLRCWIRAASSSSCLARLGSQGVFRAAAGNPHPRLSPSAACLRLVAVLLFCLLPGPRVSGEYVPHPASATLQHLSEPVGGFHWGVDPRIGTPVIVGDDIRVPAGAQTLNVRLVCGTAVVLRWNTTPGTLYRVVLSYDLRTWTQLNATWIGTGTAVTVHDDVGARTKFYRVERDAAEVLR